MLGRIWNIIRKYVVTTTLYGLPIGILTSFVGVPFFLYLLVKKDYRFE